MIKEALEYIVGLDKPEIMEICGQKYSDKKLNRVTYNPKADYIEMSTLTGLVDYIKAEIDQMAVHMIVQVVSPLEVRLISELDTDRIRETLAVINGTVPNFQYGSYMDHESFIIALQAKFLENDSRDLLIKFAGTVENGTVSNYGDDGVTQKATIRKGVASKEDALVPNPVKLRPYRTFMEVQQPESSFVFRMRDDGRGGVQCAIFEADGGAWRNAAMKSVKEYLDFELSNFKQFTVIS